MRLHVFITNRNYAANRSILPRCFLVLRSPMVHVRATFDWHVPDNLPILFMIGTKLSFQILQIFSKIAWLVADWDLSVWCHVHMLAVNFRERRWTASVNSSATCRIKCMKRRCDLLTCPIADCLPESVSTVVIIYCNQRNAELRGIVRRRKLPIMYRHRSLTFPQNLIYATSYSW